jgi:amidase
MTTSLSSLEYFMESLIDSEPWNHDYYTVPIPWRRYLAQIPDRPLKVAFLYDDGVVKPQPPVARALREVADRLRAAGHEGKYLPLYPF